MSLQVALIGFGEAAQAFASEGGWDAAAFDAETAPTRAASLRRAAAASGVVLASALAQALAGRPVVLSLVTAGAALAAAEAAARHLAPGCLYLDMNSVAPATKQAAARAVRESGAIYADVAIMAPVLPARRAVPLLVAGPADAAATLAALGFRAVTHVGAAIGQAAAIKLCRSVVVKGLEALTAEALLAAARADVVAEVLAALPPAVAAGADHALDRMLLHGVRRAEEMMEAAAMLETLGVAPNVTHGTVVRQQALGALGLDPPPEGLAAKLAALVGAGAR